MKHTINILLLILISYCPAMAQNQSDFDILKDTESDAVIYKGSCTTADLFAEKNFDWYRQGVLDYKPDTNAVA